MFLVADREYLGSSPGLAKFFNFNFYECANDLRNEETTV